MERAEQGGLRGMFQGLLAQLVGDTRNPPPGSVSNENALRDPSLQLDGVLSELRKRKETMRRESLRHGDGSSTPAAAPTAEDTQTATRRVHQQIREDITALHMKMGTSLDVNRLDERRPILIELEELVSGQRGSGFETRLRAAVVRSVLERCAKLVWPALVATMERAGVAWPEPEGLPPWAEKGDMARATERMVSETAEAFFTCNPGKIAERMFGVVSVWKANYPQRESAQWRTLAIQAVGYGLLAELMFEATMKLRHEAESLKAQAVRIIAAETTNVQRALDAGVSADDIDQILEEVSEMCEAVIPELAWQTVARQLDTKLKSIVR